MQRMCWCGLLVAAVMAAAGCSSAPQTMVAQGYVGKRVVRYSLEPAAEGEEKVGRLYDLKVVICSQGEGGVEVGCTETVILHNVLPRSE